MDTPTRLIEFGPFQLDAERRELLRNGRHVSLAPKPLAVLCYLATHRDRPVSKAELLARVWPDVHVSESALSSALKDLRRALGDDGTRQILIETQRRRGYRFKAPASEEPAPRGGHSSVNAAATRLVGRGPELRWLTSHAARAALGRPRVVVLSGAPGVGKTRLLERLCAHPVCAEFAIGIGHFAHAAARPYAGLTEALSARLAHDAASQLLAEDAASLQLLIGPTLGVTRGAESDEVEAAERSRAELFAAVRELLTRLAQRRATLLALEDLQHADAASLELFAELVRSFSCEPGGARLLWVVTTRPPEPGEKLEAVLRGLGELVVTQQLEGLGLGGIRELVQALGYGRPGQDELRRLRNVTDGNPLHVEQLLRLQSGAAAASHPLDGLRSVIAARIERLTPGCRAVLSAGALCGERFGLELLVRVRGRPREIVLGELREAAQAGLLREADSGFGFEHGLVREVICERTPPSLRRALHREIAAALEEQHGSEATEHALEIARHLLRAGDAIAPEKRMAYARRAAEQAAALCAWREAARFGAAAAAAAEPFAPAVRAPLELAAGLAASHDRDVAASLRHYARAVAAYEKAGDAIGQAWSQTYLTRARLSLPSASTTAPLDARPLEELLTRLGEHAPALGARLIGTIAEVHWFAGELELALAASERAVELSQRQRDDRMSHHALLGLGMAQLSLLRVGDALASWLESAACARRTHDPWLEAAPGARIALAQLLLGRLPEARERGKEALARARRAQHTAELGLASAHLASLEVVAGEFAESERHLRTSLSALDRNGVPWPGVFALCARASLAAHRGAWSEAGRALDDLVTPGRVFDKPGATAQFVAAALREWLSARRGDGAVDARRAARLVGSLRTGRLEPYVLGAVCGLAEVSEALGDRALIAVPEQMLRAAHEHGIELTAGWVFSVPRVLGRCARLAGRADEAERWLERALERTRRSGARVELGQTLLDRARLHAEHGANARALRDLDEALVTLDELELRPALRAAHELRQALARPR
ncbi:MAG TPA: AAA family ATPase [Myxococcota bacterium]|nr:AAA family ATPase [Myxococcota bacterium]